MANGVTLESLRLSLIRQEDTIIFGLIERARFPTNSPTYNESYVSTPTFSGTLVHFVVKETEALQAKAGRYANPEEHPFFPDNLPPSVVPPYNFTEAGRYANPEEHPFFPDNLPPSVVPPYNFTEVLYPPAASININKDIWDMYFKKLLQLFVAPGDDGNYASTAASDLVCLQALSRRIHYGKLVAEVIFRESPGEYEPAIRAKDRDALMKLLTFESVEEEVKRRVAKKAMVFGQEVTLNNDDNKGKYKVDP
nr:chorismate mutase 2 [Quercus suber]